MSLFRDVVVIVGLQGNVKAVRRLISELPLAFPASILVVWQVPSDVLDLERGLSEDGASLPFLHAHEGQRICKSYVYLGSPYANLVARPWGAVGFESALANDRRHTGIERCLDSVAHVWGNRVIAVLLSQDDEVAAGGVAAVVKSNGGVVIAQNSTKVLSLQVPLHDIEWSRSHYEMPIEEIASFLMRLTGLAAPAVRAPMSRKMRRRMIYGC
jgi:two-component system chemotaxis response regulator CheB